MKKHEKIIKKVEGYLLNKYDGVLIENTSSDENYVDWDISITSTTKNNLVSTYSVKPNNTYKNNKVCIEFRKLVDGEMIPSGIGSSKSDYIILTFYDDKNYYMIKREKLLDFAYEIKNKEVPKYTAFDSNNCQLALFDRPSLLRKCHKI